jgi:2-polyprenyl-3-methyl-5-hydroxy-6-metoxy-1,4-benzoquinol methylase
LSLLIAKFIQKNNYYDFLYHILRDRNVPDSLVFKKIKPYLKPVFVDTHKSLEKNASFLVSIISQHIQSPKSYLDIGCGKCDLTGYIGKALHIPASNVYGADIKEEFEVNWSNNRKNNKMITFEYIENGIPFGNKKFDIISCFMVLHHVHDVETLLNDIYNRLSAGGLFFIREHNCIKPDDMVCADLVHSLFILQNNELDIAISKIQAQHIFYKSADDWSKLLKSIGFKEVYIQMDMFSVSNNYKAIYIKD